jgi:hypothetical protein
MTPILFRLWLGALVMGASVAASLTGVSADDIQPSIREFDIPTIERLGREMYEQDQLAWKATDVLRAAQSDNELRALKMHGWIVDKNGVSDVVRFIHDGANGPEALCDVDFTDGKPSGCNKPSTIALSPDKLGQYKAHLLALANVQRPCSERYNTIALKRP